MNWGQIPRCELFANCGAILPWMPCLGCQIKSLFLSQLGLSLLYAVPDSNCDFLCLPVWPQGWTMWCLEKWYSCHSWIVFFTPAPHSSSVIKRKHSKLIYTKVEVIGTFQRLLFPVVPVFCHGSFYLLIWNYNSGNTNLCL